MAMRRGHHTSRVLSALGSKPSTDGNGADYSSKLDLDEILPNQFENVHEEEI
jgi:acetolactate synthase-1/3 small subunit